MSSDTTAVPRTDYSAPAAARYWGDERLAGIPRGDRRAEDLAVLCRGQDATVADGYGQWELRTLDRLLGTGRLGTLVDVGCGVGRVSAHLARRADAVVGVDVSAEMAERARLRLAGHADARVHCAPAGDLPVGDGRADTAVCLGVFEHLPAAERSRALGEIARILRPGGVFVLELNNRSAFLAGNRADNPFRLGTQLDNGYYCEVVDADALMAQAHALGLGAGPVHANPFFSTVRHLLAGEPPDVLASAVSFAVDLDVRTGGGGSAPSRVVCDQLMARLVKR
jgi:SAM-dependent methyltransferase